MVWLRVAQLLQLVRVPASATGKSGLESLQQLLQLGVNEVGRLWLQFVRI
jgi:hypothetical protein